MNLIYWAITALSFVCICSDANVPPEEMVVLIIILCLCICRTSRLKSMPTMTSTRVWMGTSRRWSRLWAARRKQCSSNTDWMTWTNAGATWRPNPPTYGQLKFNTYTGLLQCLGVMQLRLYFSAILLLLTLERKNIVSLGLCLSVQFKSTSTLQKWVSSVSVPV